MIPLSPSKAPPQSTGAGLSEALEIPRALTSFPEKEPRDTHVDENARFPFPKITYTPPQEVSVRQPPAKAAQRRYRAHEPNSPKNVAGRISKEPRKLASRAVKIAARSETIPGTAKRDGAKKSAAVTDFWWKKPKDGGAEDRHATLDPTAFWWR